MQEILNIFLLEVSKIVEHNVDFIMHWCWRQFSYLSMCEWIINLVGIAICRVVRLEASCLLVVYSNTFAYQKTPLHGILKESCNRLWQVTGTCHMQQTALPLPQLSPHHSLCNTLAIRKQKFNNVASQPAQPQLQFVCLTVSASVCMYV